VVVGVVLGFAMGAVAEVFLMGGGWYSVLEDVLYPLAFVFALAGAFSGGFLLLAAEHEGDQRRAWRAVAVFVASTVFAALLFWGRFDRPKRQVLRASGAHRRWVGPQRC
jgi:hypothetical protein